MLNLLKKFTREDEGAVAVEYVLLFLIAVAALIVSAPLVKAAVEAAYARITTLLGTVAT